MRDAASTKLRRSPAATGVAPAPLMDRARQASVLVLALGQVAAPPLLFPDGFRVATPGPVPAAGPTPLEPAGYAFIIWSAIFGGSLAYAVLQAGPGARADPLYRAIGWRTAVGFSASIGWLAAARFGPLWATVPLIMIMWTALTSAFVMARRITLVAGAAPSQRQARALVLLPLALYAGWLSVAIFANSAEVLRAYGVGIFERAPVPWSIAALLIAAAVGAGLLARTHYSLGYAAAVEWALVGIAVANVSRGISIVVASIATILAVLLAVVTLAGRRAARGP